MITSAFALAAAPLLAGASCGSDTNSAGLTDARPVVDNYTRIVHASYADALMRAEALEASVEDLIAAPSAAGLTASRDAWIAAREPYGQTEAFRFYDGPIDDPKTGPEGRINAWPLDELYIDYVVGDATAGIINKPDLFPTITEDLLTELNEKDGEKNISLGYHAIEFLLWGQDRDPAGAGNRPYTDYVLGDGGTGGNQQRRGEYLHIAAELLVDDLRLVEQAWKPDATNYAATFRTADPKESLRKMLQGMGSLSGAELSGERMQTAYDNRDQEDEHSCFSDNTHRDLYLNALAIQNVYLGKYGTIDGPGLDELVRARNPALDTRFKQQVEASLAAIQAIPTPFDQAIQTEASRPKIHDAVKALQTQTETLVEIAALLGITINLE